MISIGVDLGQRRDPSAIAVIERPEWVAGRWQAVRPMVTDQRLMRGDMVVRHLERVKLGTPYSQVVKRVVEVARHPCLGNARRRLLVDATGVGTPVIEMLRAERPGCEMTPVLITGGHSGRRDGNGWEMVPKTDLLATVQANLENGQLRIARNLRETGRLVQEMLSLGGSEHDDLAMAVALAVWGVKTGLMYGFRSEFLPVY